MKKLLIIGGLVAALAIPFTAFAATSDSQPAKAVRGFFGIDASKLTEQQKADLESYDKKIHELQKEKINKMIENGTVTKEQGESAIKRMDEMEKFRQENGITSPGMGRGMGKGFGGKGGPGMGKGRGCCQNAITPNTDTANQ